MIQQKSRKVNFSTSESAINNHRNVSSYTKRFPPYGKQLHNLRRKGLMPRGRVVVSTCWELGGAFHRIVIPENTKPANLQFAYLAGLFIQIVHHDGEPSLVQDLIQEILKIKPKVLTVFNYDLAKNNFSGNPASTLIYPEILEALPYGA